MYMNKTEWPDGKKCAAMVTVNLDAEYFWLQLDPNCHDKPKTLSMGQYGMLRGLKRVLEVLEKFKVKATFFVPGIVAEKYQIDMKTIISKGHEIANHGYRHENLALLTYDEQKDVLCKGIKAIEKYCGLTPRGFRVPEGELTLDTLKIAKELGFDYSSNLSDDDRPYFKRLGKDESILEIPIHWALFDLPYFAFNYKPAFPAGQGRISNYTGVLNNWKDEFYGYHDYGLCYVLQIDPQTIGNPGRIGILEELLEYINELGDTWFATGSEMYDYYMKTGDR